MNIGAVVVSYNRRKLLHECLSGLAMQGRPLDKIIVVDNASTDGTVEWLTAWLPKHLPSARLLALGENVGGAGGFAAGLRVAIESGVEWIWMMDDDACPYADALEQLLKIATSPRNIYGSLAANERDTSWPITLLEDGRTVCTTAEVPARAKVEFAPLLGFFIHRSLVQEIGYPDAGFFIAADDVEYCLRARRAGADIILAGQSRIEHPRTVQHVLCTFGVRFVYLSLAPWKRYYDTRNRLLIARRHHGIKLFTHAIPGSFVRLFVALVSEPRKLAQFHAITAGIIDGLLGNKGKRHETWGLKQ